MNILNKRSATVALAAIIAIVGAAVVGSTAVSADDSRKDSSISNKIAERFQLSEDEVQSVVEEFREENKANRSDKRAEKKEAKLQSLVDEGLISTDQKSLIEAKFSEQMTALKELKSSNLSMEQKMSQIQEIKTELKEWAELNSIDIEAIMNRHDSDGQKTQHLENYIEKSL